MAQWILEPWPWWLSGVLVGLTVPLLYLLAGKAFGISTSFQQIDAMCCARSRIEYFRGYDKQAGIWTLVFAVGIAVGGFVANWLLSAQPVEFLPSTYEGWPGFTRLIVGGFLVGLGTRYAGGCTSGHSITGISNLNWPSLLATVCFFAGGLAVTWGLRFAL